MRNALEQKAAQITFLNNNYILWYIQSNQYYQGNRTP